MKAFKITSLIFFLLVIGIIVYSMISRNNSYYYETTTIKERDIVERIYIPGNVFPIKEIEIKSQLSGILDKVLVNIGDVVSVGSTIASISIVPNSSDIEVLENNVNLARIDYDAYYRIYERNKQLYDARAISKIELEEAERTYLSYMERYNSAQNQLSLLRDGVIHSKEISNIVKSSISGVVIDIPQEEGVSVIERNNFNPGTTIAVVAEMERFRFRAKIAEHFLKYIFIGMPIQLSFTAYDDLNLTAYVQKISAKGIEENGIVKYIIDAEFDVPDSIPFLRSGYSATADVVFNQRLNTISLEEKYINFKNDSIYVNVLDQTKKQTVVKKLVKIGVSDGVYTEIMSGIDSFDKIVTESFAY